MALKPGLAVPPILRPRRRVSGALQRGMCGHVLIIEDEILIAFVLEDELRDLGFTSFDFAVSAEEALASAQLRKPDLITVDYRINGGTGVEALERLDRELGALPAIFVTANPELIAGDRAPVVGKPLRPGCYLPQGLSNTVNVREFTSFILREITREQWPEPAPL